MDVLSSTSLCPVVGYSLVQSPPASTLLGIGSWFTAQRLPDCSYVLPLSAGLGPMDLCTPLFDLWQIKQLSYPTHFPSLLCFAKEALFSLSILENTIFISLLLRWPPSWIIAIFSSTELSKDGLVSFNPFTQEIQLFSWNLLSKSLSWDPEWGERVRLMVSRD